MQHISSTKRLQKLSDLPCLRRPIVAQSIRHDIESQDPGTFALGTFKLTMEAACPKACDAKQTLGQHVRECFFAYAAIDLEEWSKLSRPEGFCPARNTDSNRASRDEVFVCPVAQFSRQTKEIGDGMTRELASAACWPCRMYGR